MEPQKILVIDDEPDLREALTAALTQAGFSVVSAADGQDGYELALREHPMLILTDVNMPTMSGHELVKKLRSDIWGSTAKIIFLTASNDVSDVARALGQGSKEYIVKDQVPLSQIVNRCMEICR